MPRLSSRVDWRIRDVHGPCETNQEEEGYDRLNGIESSMLGDARTPLGSSISGSLTVRSAVILDQRLANKSVGQVRSRRTVQKRMDLDLSHAAERHDGGDARTTAAVGSWRS